MAENISITVKLRQYKGKNTSARKSVSKKKGKTSSSPKAEGFNSLSGMSKVKSMLSGSGALAVGGGIMAISGAVGAGINTHASIAGSITGNRFSEKRDKAIGSLMKNPATAPFKIAKRAFERTFEVRRELERIDVKRRKTNTYMPFRYGNSGVTV